MKSNSKKSKYPPPKPLKGEIARVVAYWRDALAEGERASLNPKEFMALGLEMALADVVGGKCTPHAIRTLSEKAERKEEERSRGKQTSVRRDPEQRVLICPLRFSRRERGPGPRFLEILWIPALLTPTGELLPPRDGAPWIPREHLEPVLLDNGISVGDSAAVDKFADKYPAESWQDWKEYWRYCVMLVKAVTGATVEALEIDDYDREQAAFITLDTSSTGSTLSLLRVLDEVLQGKRHVGLLPQLTKLAGPTIRTYPRSVGLMAKAAAHHTGQFGNKFPLAPSQRLAVHRFLGTAQADFLCVTGPPGTGKTTLLQSIVASLWVSAVEKNALPPVIVACGATNQSVTNIIDSLEKTSDANDALSERWLPNVHSYGTFCCSATKAKEIEGYQLELQDGNGLSNEMERPEYVSAAKEYFLSHFAAATGKQLPLEKAVEALRLLVGQERRAVAKEVFLAKNGTTIEWLQSFVGKGKKITTAELFKTVSELDTTSRNRAFQLATHYWEGRWLLTMAAEFSRATSEDGAPDRRRARYLKCEPREWRRRAMITPAFVSTLSMTPRFFAARPNPDSLPIDLLIFDEAGQIPVEMGAACAALAKQAVVVGDTQQLEPMWNVPPHIDRANAAKHKLAKLNDAAGWKALVKRGVAASSGSLMKLAIRSTPWEEKREETGQTTHGVFLREHRRCVPPLVRFCNALSYGDRLEPLRPDLKERILPAFGYVHVAGFSQQLRQSRYNRLEVEQIAAWINKCEANIKRFYESNSISDLVAVITPFTAQTRKLEERLRRRYPDMTIGTVNSLQGAERRIVIFSPVYDAGFDGRYFFDRGKNMLNVAVSRAQDSFLVIGDMAIFKPEAETPSGLLAHFLFEQPEHELAPVTPVRSDAIAAEEIGRITTLEEHQDELFRAFEHAKHELFIVSPTISIAAIRHDRIPEQIREARKRNVRVRIFTDSYLDSPDGKLKENAAEGRKILNDAGATVHIVKAIHNKAVAIDDHTLVEGSFNWLSAVRTVGSIHQKLEISCRYTGPNTAERIRTLREELEHRERLLLG